MWGHDDIPEMIKDPEAAKPEDWDDEDDGEWEAPSIANPAYAGAWTQKEIDNPAYKVGQQQLQLRPGLEAVDPTLAFRDFQGLSGISSSLN